MTKRIINILWTGGLDSTCRIVELSRTPFIIQPFYLIDSSRRSTQNEIAAMDAIRKLILDDKRTKSELLPTKYVEITDILPQPEISHSWRVLNQKYGLGIQYDWLARFASQQQLILEICLEKTTNGKATKTVNGECRLLSDHSPDVSEYYIDENNSSSDAKNIFGNLCFPISLWNMTKQEEVDEIKSLGLSEIVKKTWFCHHPVLGLPCGHCNPCRDVREAGMSWRIPLLGYSLGALRQTLSKVRRLCIFPVVEAVVLVPKMWQ